ncbi:MAG: DUF4440 domain-containing protein [Actinomycetota bacterium]
MLQHEEKVKPSPPIKTIPEAGPALSGAVPWLIAAIVALAAVSVALAAVIVVPRYRVSEGERLAQDTVQAWDSSSAASLSELYARDAVIERVDGTKAVGIDEIVADAKALRPSYTLTQAGDVTTSPDGSFAVVPYRYSGNGRGGGIMLIKVSDGTIARQWTFEAG